MELKRLKLIGKEEDVIEVREEDIVVPDDRYWQGYAGPYIGIRSTGEFENRGFLLDEKYKWVIGEDSRGLAILLALRKKP